MSSSSSSSDSTSSGSGVRTSWGAFTGVVAPSLLSSMGLILLLRGNIALGETGVVGGLGLIVLINALVLLSALSISAIATNMQQRGGGAYYLVSRVLGPEFGGAVGLILFCAQVAAAVLCLIGFTEMLLWYAPALQIYRSLVVFGALAVVFAGTSICTGWVPRANHVLAALVLLAFVAAFGGAVQRFTPEQLAENWGAEYTLVERGGVGSFWGAFALYFPVAAGILVSVNMAHELKNPSRGIPRGVLTIFGLILAVSTAHVLICGGAFDRGVLVQTPYAVFHEQALFGAGLLVAAGVFAAAVGGAVGNLVGAARVIEAVVRDGLLPLSRVLGKSRPGYDEPRRSLALAAIAAGALLAALQRTPETHQLNGAAAVLTRLALYTLGALNAAAFLQAFFENPNFRPQFRLFHWWTALAGAVGCFGVALFIRPVEALAVFVLLAALTWYIKKRELDEAFGDAERGFLYKAARNNLVKLSYLLSTPKSWRPTSLVFSGNPETREALVSYAVWLSAGRGIVFLANILVGKFEEYAPHRDAVARRLKEFCAWKRIQAFPIVVVAPTLQQGISSILQTVSLGPILPNVALFGWSGDAMRVHVSIEQYRMAKTMDMSIVVVHGDERPFFYDRKRVDIWWRDNKNGPLMLLLAHLLTQNWEWSRMTLRILRLVDSESAADAARTEMEQILEKAEISADIETVLPGDSFATVFQKESADADCIFLGFDVPSPEEEAAWYATHKELLHEMPTTILVCSEAPEDVLA